MEYVYSLAKVSSYLSTLTVVWLMNGIVHAQCDVLFQFDQMIQLFMLPLYTILVCVVSPISFAGLHILISTLYNLKEATPPSN